jgi:ribosomal protein S18 acetylase RimI-like enzyme
MKSDEYTIRPPQTQEEWDIIPGLLMDYKHEFDDETCFTSFEEELADIRKVYTALGNYFIIASENSGKKIVGFVGMRTFSPGVAEMKRLYVVPSHRGNQLGKKLALEIISYTKENNFNSMLLDTMHEMRAAQRLYQQLGFSIVKPYHNQDPSKVVCYEKKFI